MVKINKSLGGILSQVMLKEIAPTSSTAHSALISKCSCLGKKARSSRFREIAREFLGKIDQRKRLPLFICHFDLNQVHNLIDENHQVSGIVDWELSSLLLFEWALAGFICSPVYFPNASSTCQTNLKSRRGFLGRDVHRCPRRHTKGSQCEPRSSSVECFTRDNVGALLNWMMGNLGYAIP